MAQPYVGEIRMFAGNFAPAGWMFCEGQLLPISENETLFNLIGTTYGGDGQSTFALPDFQGRIPIHQGTGFVIGQKAGTESTTLTENQLPLHTHPAQAQTAAGNQGSPAAGVWAQSSLNQFSTAAANSTMNNTLIQPAGGSQPHDNMMPFLTLSFIIALFGVFPSQS